MYKMTESCLYVSPIGVLDITQKAGKLVKLSLRREEDGDGPQTPIWSDGTFRQSHVPHDDNGMEASALLSRACRQLDEYFAGRRKRFDLPVCCEGTVFQRRVWEALTEIPYGETRSYEEIAVQIGSPKAQRAIGQANHCNPVLIVVPCHRVIHKNGDISGFACGLEAKRYLLSLEKRFR